MDKERKRQLQEACKNRKPPMGVIAFTCRETGESFLAASTDTKAGFNRSLLQLGIGSHPNKRLQELWKQYGEAGFEQRVAEELDYENAEDDHREDLDTLLDLCLARDDKAVKMYK
jgi:hypothetical protein